MNFVATATLGAKGNWVKGSCGRFDHKLEVRAGLVGVHCRCGGLIVPRLAQHIAKATTGEISTKNNELLVIEFHLAGIQENCLF